MTTGVIVSQLETLNGSAPAPEELPKGDIAQRIAVLNGLMPKEDLKPSNGEICKQLDIYIENGGGGQPTGTISITENGTVDVTDYASASVNVPDDGGLSAITSGIRLLSPSVSTSLDLSRLRTESFTTMSNMFSGCNTLTSLDVSGWDTSNVTNMSSMFFNCSSLTSLNASGWDTSNVTDMQRMFSGCAKIESINMGGLDTSKSTSMNSMFANCLKLTSINMTGWDLSAVTNSQSMFQGCSVLPSLDMSWFNPASNVNLTSMFSSCKELESLDLRLLSTPNTTAISSMFQDCSKLESVYLPKIETGSVTAASGVIKNCTALEALIWATDMQTVQPMVATSANFGFNSAPNCIVYVPDSLVASYKSATNWSSVADRIKGVSELPQEYKDLYDI